MATSMPTEEALTIEQIDEFYFHLEEFINGTYPDYVAAIDIVDVEKSGEPVEGMKISSPSDSLSDTTAHVYIRNGYVEIEANTGAGGQLKFEDGPISAGKLAMYILDEEDKRLDEEYSILSDLFSLLKDLFSGGKGKNDG